MTAFTVPAVTNAWPDVRTTLGVVLLLACLYFLSSHCLAADAQPDLWLVRSANEAGGKLAIVLQDGRTVFVPAGKHQCSFENVQIASDGVTVGWTEGKSAEGQNDIQCGPNSIYVAAGPAVWRKGKLLHTFKNSGAEMNWSFYRGGKFIAVHAGPSHFDDQQSCVLYDVATGRVSKEWSHAEKTDPPDWAAGIVDQ